MNFLRLALETRKKGAVISLFLNIPKFNVKTNHVHVAVSIPQKPPTQNFWSLGHFCGGATIFRVYKGNFQKYKGKYSIFALI
jgi:hypothetical protein